MDDCFMSCNEQLRDAFFRALELEPELKALQSYLQSIARVQFPQILGKDGSKKVKTMVYSGLLLVMKLCHEAGVNLKQRVPEPIFFQMHPLELRLLPSKVLSVETKRVLKNSQLISVGSRQNAMKALALAVKYKPDSKLPVFKGMQQECQLCGKPRRTSRSFVYQGLSDCLVLQLLPFKPYFHKVLVRNGFNPRLEIYLQANKLLAEIIEHLTSKWLPTRLENNGQEFVISLMAPWQNQFIEYSRNQEKITIGDVFLSLESPIPLQVFYYWKPVETSGNEESAAESNSLPFFTQEDESQVKEESSFKSLLRTTINPFSKGEAASDSGPAEIKHDAEESLFSTFFKLSKS